MTRLLTYLAVCAAALFAVLVLSAFAEAQGADSATTVASDAGPAAATVDAGVAAAPVEPDANGTPPTAVPADAGSIAKQVVTDVRGGRWRYVAAGMLGLLMIGLAKIRDKSWSPFKGDRGGAALILLLALVTSFSVALASDSPLGLDLILGAGGTAFTAAGGYTVIKRLLWPSDAPPKLTAVK